MMSKRLIASYVLDWIVIILIVAVGGGINGVEPYKRPFSLVDLSISFPIVKESVSTGILVGISFGASAAIIFLVVAIAVPGPRGSRDLSRSKLWMRKFWELEKGWAGLALSLAIAFLFTQGLKLLFGKPRPSCIARCMPDMSKIEQYTVGGYATALSPEWVLVGAGICTNPDTHTTNDGFKSFPSGHASFSWSGLLYLSFFLCSKFAIRIPYLPIQGSQDPLEHRHTQPQDREMLPLHQDHTRAESNHTESSYKALHATSPPPTQPAHSPGFAMRNQAASPPNHLIIVAILPVAVAMYICSTRYAEFYHFGFDLLGGSLIGILSAWFSFRWYHLPIGRGSGWAWGPRSRDRAFGIGVGVGNYVGDEGWKAAKEGRRRHEQEAPV
ncbi:hypothetical protein B0A48_07976 [Cryoendolithus antarcticus]|uniref:Phosphatidic acid phosphatase type 2/haloperoxidase domain-containing protein n=1 Tax=Cryoendolithus antarcticus TaxID=1507870 RepID=A0A1V8T160_9PEZI|nr:hypothetical protein B0A48_07976 [Cryoendolithus antarcticus]